LFPHRYRPFGILFDFLIDFFVTFSNTGGGSLGVANFNILLLMLFPVTIGTSSFIFLKLFYFIFRGINILSTGIVV